MEVTLTRPAHAKAGDTVVVKCKLRPGQDLAKLQVWSAVDGFELSPHVFHSQMRTDLEGVPAMVKPLSFWLRGGSKEQHTVEFISDEALDYVVIQNIDVSGDPTAKARISVYGKTLSSIRRLCRDAFRALRDRTESHFGNLG